jgi:hypothetical protein
MIALGQTFLLFLAWVFLVIIFSVPSMLMMVFLGRKWDKRTWYGPHPCIRCGKTICRTAQTDGGTEFDYPIGPIYPNTVWGFHKCQPRQTTDHGFLVDSISGDGK